MWNLGRVILPQFIFFTQTVNLTFSVYNHNNFTNMQISVTTIAIRIKNSFVNSRKLPVLPLACHLFPISNLRHLLDVFSLTGILFSWECHISGIKLCVSFIQYNAIKIQPSCCSYEEFYSSMSSILLYGYTTVGLLFTHLRTFKLFPGFGNYEETAINICIQVFI